MENKSTALRMMLLICRFCENHFPAQPLKRNLIGRDALECAVRLGVDFDIDDLETIARMMSISPRFKERLYSLAVQHNISAADSIEHWLKRPAFTVSGRRLAVGSQIEYGDKGRLKVTSFTSDGKLVASACGTSTIKLTQEGFLTARRTLKFKCHPSIS